MANVIAPSKILIPKGISMEKWSCIACDQHTSEENYWSSLSEFVGDAPSTLKITFPEVYLGKNDDERIKKINDTMRDYLDKDMFNEYFGYILVVRTLSSGTKRLGLCAMVDLEEYSYELGAKPQIRATEGTILSRIPPRVKIRKNAALEVPHIMLLINDKKKTVIEELYKKRDAFQKVYDFNLNKNGGKVEGYYIKADYPVPEMMKGVECTFQNDKIALAVGDGNHSLATAKACYEEKKKLLGEEQAKNSNARYALCEIVNLYDDSLTFEPIHRILFNVDNEKFVAYLKEKMSGCGNVTVLYGDKKENISAPSSSAEQVRCVQECIDAYLLENGGRVDYIHGEEVVKNEAKKGNIGILLSAIKKDDLFDWIIKKGTFPRKTFSMGEAEDKRYYLECRKISGELKWN